jgi:hypothetical protein
MAHQHDVEHAHVLVGELILLELAQPFVRIERDVAARRLEIAAENADQRRLAAPLAPIRPVPIPVTELTLMFSNRGFAPNWSVMLAAVSTVFRDVSAMCSFRARAWRFALRSAAMRRKNRPFC